MRFCHLRRKHVWTVHADRPGFDIPKPQVLKDLSYVLLVSGLDSRPAVHVESLSMFWINVCGTAT